jgi:MerR family mercuric resistance operon transcriptional regulator
MQPFTIGRLAAATGVNLETVRYYERIELMPSPARTANGRRAYEEGHIRRLAFIRRARELGFSIEQIRALLALAEPSRASCAEVREIAQAHLDEVRAKLADLARLESILAETVSRCSGDPAPSCPVLDMLAASNGAPINRSAKIDHRIKGRSDALTRRRR